MELAVHYRSRLLIAAALSVGVVLALAFVHPATSTIPTGSVVGKVTYTDISGSADLTVTIRSFSITETTPSPGSRTTFGQPKVVADVGAGSPLIMSAVALQRMLPSIVVTLYRPSSVTKLQQWTFTDAVIMTDNQSQIGPATATPWETVTWVFDTIRQETYQVDGITVSRSVCFDLGAYATC